MKTALLAAALLAAIAAPAEARKAKAPEFVGEWCLTETVVNGHDSGTGEYIPNHRAMMKNTRLRVPPWLAM
jgi:hypothetical protein